MSHSYIIEIGSKAVGLVHRENERSPFVFIAADRRFAALEGRTFALSREAERAARQLAAGKAGGPVAGRLFSRN